MICDCWIQVHSINIQGIRVVQYINSKPLFSQEEIFVSLLTIICQLHSFAYICLSDLCKCKVRPALKFVLFPVSCLSC